jgi:hypothetical protein
VHDSVEVPDPAILVGLRVHVNPVAGATAEATETTPVNPPMLVTVMVEVPGVPSMAVTVVGLEESVKSGGVTGFTVKITDTE